MEGHCSTGQSPQWAVVPMEEEDSAGTEGTGHSLNSRCSQPGKGQQKISLCLVVHLSTLRNGRSLSEAKAISRITCLSWNTSSLDYKVI